MSNGKEKSKGEPVTLVRKLAAPDVSAVVAILHESPEASAWSSDSLLRMVSAGWPTMWVADRDGSVAGFLIGRSVADEFEIQNMAVAAKHRRHGVGSKLLESALEFSRTAGIARVYLEVRASNARAITLYKGHGFTGCGRRTRYYRDPVEDAILLSLSLA
jgi:[ribosomal protein S18]-alanine N-acetyltransferase